MITTSAPADWEIRTLGQLGRVVRGGSPRPAGDPRYFNGAFIPWLTVAALTTIPESQMRVVRTATNLTEEGAKRSRTLQPETLIIANSGATLGVAKILGIASCANDGIAAVVDQHSGRKEFLCYYLNTQTTHLREVVASGNGQPNLNTSLIREIKVPFPSDPEQRAIVDVLAEVDSLIESLRALVTKKRAVKQGMMQELLTGRTRLGGIASSWTTLRVAAASHVKARIGWQGLTTAEYRKSGEYRLVGGSDFLDGRVNWDTTPYVDKARFDQDPNIQLQVGDVLITKDGTIGKVALVDALPGPTTLNSGVFVVRPKRDAYDSRFLYCILRSRAFEEFVGGLSAGSTINHLYQKDLVRLTFNVPSDLAEQRTIAAVLLDADAEIEMLERRLKATRAIKQGVMQELLTGRTRLPSDRKVAV
ncbi:restriction endonuclease subunit S [Agromyces albus]|uniref:restriction endonuclease subunit S n=1 Tax=Agromyces albus TaxID=205332 RepID=UPI002786E1A7|nr:restriction endonuclease subunit S [Agromyces albus]MDQ0575267.1 type I restriction enzyme S subunit [Agromyces albus]